MIIVLSIVFCIMLSLRLYMFEDHHMAEVGGKPMVYPLFVLKSGYAYFCWLTGIDIHNGYVSPVYRGFITTYHDYDAIAIEIAVGLSGILVGLKKSKPYFIFDVGRRSNGYKVD